MHRRCLSPTVDCKRIVNGYAHPTEPIALFAPAFSFLKLSVPVLSGKVMSETVLSTSASPDLVLSFPVS